jgi:hypothetical protein
MSNQGRELNMQMRLSIRLAIVLVLAVACGYTQVITSSVVGTVADTSGAMIPDAQITLKNMDTGIASKTVSNVRGEYSVLNLQEGRYSVQVKKTGFATIEVTDIHVLAAQIVRQDVTLKVGEVQETVVVTGAAPMVKTDSHALGGSLLGRQLADAPISARTINNLMQLAPGVVQSGSGPAISGSLYWGGTNFTLNGVSVNDSGNGGGAYANGGADASFATYPSPDSFQEFRVDAGTNSAEFSRMATIAMVMKQGTNAFHGYASDNMMTTNLTANSFTNNATGLVRPAYHSNDFGADFSGPAIKNKLFFYGAYHGIRRVVPATIQVALPTVAERNGDFSALYTNGTQLYDPLSGAPFVNNQIPTSRFTSQSKALMGYVPVPTVTSSLGLPNGTANYYAPTASRKSVNGLDFRGDYQVSDKDSVNGVLHYSKGSPWFNANPSYPTTYGNQQDFGYIDWAVTATETHVFGPTAVNDIRAAWVVHASQRTGQNTDITPQTFFPQSPIVDNGGLPQMLVSGYSGMPYDYGKGYRFPEYDIQITDNFTKIYGRHTLKFGIDETGFKTTVNQGGPSLASDLGSRLGSFSFNGAWTGGKGWPTVTASQGNSFADFLLGYLTSDNYAQVVQAEQETARDWEFYAQDTFQATPRLTLYYGLRYMYQTPWRVRDDRVTYLDLKNNKLALPQDSNAVTTPATAVPAQMAAYAAYFETTQQAGWPKSYYQINDKNFAPRIGFAYRPLAGNKTVVRGGWGYYYSYIPGYVGQWENTFNTPWRGANTYSSLLPGKPTTAFLPDLTFANPFPGGNAGSATASPLLYMTARDLRNPAIFQYSLTLEQQFASHWAGRATYLGEQVRQGLWYAGNINIPNVQQPNVPAASQRPYNPWSTIYETLSGGNAHMNQLQMELNKRFSSGFLVQAQYAFTQAMTNFGTSGYVQNPSCARCDMGNDGTVVRHSMIVNYVWDLPVGRGKALNINNRVLDGIVGGWSVSGITIYQTGGTFSVSFAVPSSVVGWAGGRADVVAGADMYAGRNKSSHDIINGVPWFNTAAFAPPAKWTWGNSEKGIGYGPGLWNYDFGLRKSFKLPERMRLEFRADFLDAFNHSNLTGPNTSIADTRDGGTPNLTTGKIYGITGGGPNGANRIVQLGMKLSF